MNIFAISGFINGISALIFGVIVYSRDTKRLVYKTFGLMTFSLGIWSLAYGFWQIASDKQTALFWTKILSIGSTFIPIFFLHWIFSLLNIEKKKGFILILGYIVTIILLCFSLTDLYIESVSSKLIFSYWPNPGIVYSLYLIFGYFGLIGYAIFELLKAYKKSRGYLREQIKYILVAVIVGFGGGATNFPLWYNIPLMPYGNFLIFLYPFILSYAILKYRLMDIRFILGRGAIYFVSFILVIALAFSFMFVIGKFFPNLSFNVSWIITLILGILIFPPIFRYFEGFSSKYFYYSFYSYQKVLTDLSKKLTQFLDLRDLSSLIVKTLIETMKLDRTVILLKNTETKSYEIQRNIGFKEENGISLVKDNYLTSWLEKKQKPLVYEEISLIVRDNPKDKEKMEKIQENMKRIEASLCLPLFIEDKLFGMIVLGNKISKDPYSEQDIDLLINLSNQASIALQNAKLYSEIKNFNVNLEKEVSKRTGELKEAYEELKKLDRAKTEFVSIASHQLRTPLTAIKGYISMMLENTYGKPPAKMKRPLENIFASNERLIRLVNDLLNISRIESGKTEIVLEKDSLEETVSSVVEELKASANEKRISLVFKKPKKPLDKIMMDKFKLRQVILNLIDNAIRYTVKGEISVEIRKTDSKAILSVSDTGEGMTKEEIDHLFESFSRGKAGNRLWTEGAGLGLYVAKKFVDMHNGKIWAESKGKDKGSTFFVELPIK